MTWLELWPAWSNRWYGWVGRVFIGSVGGGLGLLLVVLADFGATYKKDVPEWGLEEVTFLVFGLAIVSASIWVLFRPARASIALLAVAVVGVFVAGGLV